jgi:hypothetical protein
MGLCDSISIGAVYDCKNIPQPGNDPSLVLVNKEDLNAGSITYNSAGTLITNVTLAVNRPGYLFEGWKDSVKTKIELVQLESGPMFKHMVDLVIYDVTPIQRQNLERMCRGSVSAFVEKRKKDSNSFELYGGDAGLYVVPGTLYSSNENGGVFKVSLASLDGQEEVSMQQTVLSTDYSATKSLIRGLAFGPTITSLNVTSIAAAGGTAVTVTGTNFFGGSGVNQVISVVWVNQNTGARVTQTGLSGITNTNITIASSVAVAAGNSHKLEVTTTRGVTYTVGLVTS